MNPNSDLWLTGPDAHTVSGPRPVCPRCHVTIKGRWFWRMRHRIGTCFDDRPAMRARLIQPRLELREGEVAF